MKYDNIKKSILISMLSVLFMNFYAQDLLVTKEGDSINCKITGIKSDNVYFTIVYKNEERSTYLPVEKVNYQQIDYFETAFVPPVNVPGNQNYLQFRIGTTGGWSYRIASFKGNLSPQEKKYLRELRSGFHYGFDLTCFFSEYLGLGIKYCSSQSSSELDYTSIALPNGSVYFGSVSDNIDISFIGPFLATRLLDTRKKNAFIMNLGIGYMDYTDEAVLVEDIILKGSTTSFCWEIGYDFYLIDEISLGIQASLITGVLTSIKFIDGGKRETIELEEGDYDNLSRIDLSVGLKINL